MHQYSFPRVFFFALILSLIPIASSAQWDTAVFKDGRKIIYKEVLGTGKSLPSTWFSLTLLHGEVAYFGKKNFHTDAGINFLAGQFFLTMYADFNYSLLELRRPRKSGPILMGTALGSYINGNTSYVARFNGIEGVTNFGIHGGVQRMRNYSGLNSDTLQVSTGKFRASLPLTHELEIGLSVWTRRGIVLMTESYPSGRFFIFRLNADVVFYHFTRFGMSEELADEVTPEVMHAHGDDDPQGRWQFTDLPFNKIGAKVTTDFYWSKYAGKKAPKIMFGYRARFVMQYVPISVFGHIIFSVNLGFTLGIKPRLMPSHGMVMPVEVPKKK